MKSLTQPAVFPHADVSEPWALILKALSHFGQSRTDRRPLSENLKSKQVISKMN